MCIRDSHQLHQLAATTTSTRSAFATTSSSSINNNTATSTAGASASQSSRQQGGGGSNGVGDDDAVHVGVSNLAPGARVTPTSFEDFSTSVSGGSRSKHNRSSTTAATMLSSASNNNMQPSPAPKVRSAGTSQNGDNNNAHKQLSYDVASLNTLMETAAIESANGGGGVGSGVGGGGGGDVGNGGGGTTSTSTASGGASHSSSIVLPASLSMSIKRFTRLPLPRHRSAQNGIQEEIARFLYSDGTVGEYGRFSDERETGASSSISNSSSDPPITTTNTTVSPSTPTTTTTSGTRDATAKTVLALIDHLFGGDSTVNTTPSPSAASAASNLSLIHISEPTRLLSISYAVFCLKKKKKKTHR
eukprot:TRINITY_DN14983_c0_g1_i3.p1 TRINITY_DN14983_c0_g1~~TRINITY_DN14983_c0_g1_i3.p1  ORF type:complete len:360 (+),score=96.69 TRINITY_DN14983_c0_g1_i3:131-1210(+)